MKDYATTWTERYGLKEKEPQKKLRKGEIDPEVKASKARRRANKNYYEKNKEKLNRRRRALQRTPKGKWASARNRAMRKGEEWTLTYEEWLKVWEDCPRVFDYESKLFKTAYSLLGGNPQKNTQMCRIDTDLGWIPGNVEIRYKLQPIPEDGFVPDWDMEEGRPMTWEEMGVFI